MNKQIKNLSGSTKVWQGHSIANNSVCAISPLEEKYWRVDSGIIQAISNNDADISGDGGVSWKSGNCAIGLLKMVCSQTCGINVQDSHTPSSASDTGHPGTICWDSNYIYICTAVDTWKRIAISSW